MIQDAANKAEIARNDSMGRNANLILSAIFCSFLLAVFVGYAHFIAFIQRQIARDPQKAEVLLGRRCDHGFPMPRVKGFLSGTMQKQLESACQDNFPFRDFILLQYRNASRFCGEQALNLLPQSWHPLYPMGGNMVSGSDKSRLLLAPALYRPSFLPQLRDRARYYNELAAKNPGARFFVFPEIGAASWWLKSGGYSARVTAFLDDGKYASEFEPMLSPVITYSWMGRGSTVAAALDWYFKTDHHWTMRGSWNAYKFIHSYLLRDNLSIGTAIPMDRVRDISGLEYQGSRAYQAVISGIFDRIEDVAMPLPQLKVEIPEFAIHKRSAQKADYWNGVFSAIPFYNHYGAYFGMDYPLVHYENSESKTKRNMLVVGDSMDNAMEPLLANHYRHCYFLDVRHSKLDLNKFIIDRNIHDVVFIGQQGWILGISKPLE